MSPPRYHSNYVNPRSQRLSNEAQINKSEDSIKKWRGKSIDEILHPIPARRIC